MKTRLLRYTRLTQPIRRPHACIRDHVMTECLAITGESVTRGVDILAHGGLVAFPTETVYGLGGDACNADAVAAIFAAKERPAFNPLISHVASSKAAFELAPQRPSQPV